ncbi:hypothetical protein M9458_005146, partial [Cirrhinus mrigala]
KPTARGPPEPEPRRNGRDVSLLRKRNARVFRRCMRFSSALSVKRNELKHTDDIGLRPAS